MARCRGCNDLDFGRVTILTTETDTSGSEVTICEKCGHKEVAYTHIYYLGGTGRRVERPYKNVTPSNPEREEGVEVGRSKKVTPPNDTGPEVDQE